VTLRATFMALGIVAATGAQAAMSDAQAQQQRESRAERSAATAEVPWYERFTFTPGSPATGAVSGVVTGGDRAAGWTSTNPRAPAPSDVNAPWGMTFNVGEGDKSSAGVQGARKETAVGAYFRFSPRFSVGGRLSVAEPKASTQTDPRRDRQDGDAGVKLESAFRF
jgi:hypothetical protein